MTKVKGEGVTSHSGTALANTSPQLGFLGMWASPPISGNQTIGGGAETLVVNVADSESNLASNFYVNRAHAYIWRPSTGALVGDLCTTATTPTGSPTEGTGSSATVTIFTVALSSVSALDGDIIVVELFSQFTQSAAAGYTDKIYYDGATENLVENSASTDHAAFVEFSQTITLATATPARLTNVTANVWYEDTSSKTARLTNETAVVWATSTVIPVAHITNMTAILWYEATNTSVRLSSLRAEVMTSSDDLTKRPRTFVST